MDLQNIFYVLGIITMVLLLAMLLAIVTAVFVIRSKVVSIHKSIEEKLSFVSNLGSAGSNLLESVKKATGKSA